jgi:hypothetical protein
MTRSAAIAVAYMLALSQGEAVIRGEKAYGPADYRPPKYASHDAERIARAEAKRARKAAKRAKSSK